MAGGFARAAPHRLYRGLEEALASFRSWRALYVCGDPYCWCEIVKVQGFRLGYNPIILRQSSFHRLAFLCHYVPYSLPAGIRPRIFSTFRFRGVFGQGLRICAALFIDRRMGCSHPFFSHTMPVPAATADKATLPQIYCFSYLSSTSFHPLVIHLSCKMFSFARITSGGYISRKNSRPKTSSMTSSISA